MSKEKLIYRKTWPPGGLASFPNVPIYRIQYIDHILKSFVKNNSHTGQAEQIKIKVAHCSYFGTRSFLAVTHCIHIYGKKIQYFEYFSLSVLK